MRILDLPDELQWKIFSYLQNPTASCIDSIVEKGEDKVIPYVHDVLTESMFQHHKGMRRDSVVSRKKYFIDNRRYVQTELLPELIDKWDKWSDDLMEKYGEALVYSYWGGDDIRSFDEPYYFMERLLIEEYLYREIEEGFLTIVIDDIIQENNIHLYQPCSINLYDIQYIKIRSINYWRWKNMSMKSPCRYLGMWFGEKEPSRCMFFFPRYYF